MSLSADASRALSRRLAQELALAVAAAGGDVSDVLTVTTATAARVLCMIMIQDPEAGATGARIMGEQIAALVQVLQSAEREGSVG